VSSRSYHKGRDYEYEVKRMFEEAGYEVTRSASSHGIWDLTCVRLTLKNKKVCFVALVQCKTEALDDDG